MTKSELVDLLRDAARRIAVGDSLAGSVEYAVADPFDPSRPPDMKEWNSGFMVTARYRVGNSRGQGTVREFGRPGE